MNISETLCLVRGGGDLATGVATRLFRAGFPLVVTELAQPLVVRRAVAFAEAVYAGEVEVEGVLARRLSSANAALRAAGGEYVPVVVDDDDRALAEIGPVVLVDARMAKVNLGTRRDDAPFVVGLGPGFTAGQDCHAVIETNRGHHLGRVIWQGAAAANTGRPGSVEGVAGERVLRAPRAGALTVRREIGARVSAGEALAEVDGEIVYAPFDGVLRGIAHPGLRVSAGMKIGDLDPRKERDHCFEISDKSLAIGGGVLEAVLTWMHTRKKGEDRE